MKFSAAVLALAAGANAFKNVTYTTEIVTAITTYCPEPTTVEYGGTTYTITEATTLTITDCPCTIKKPVTTISAPSYHNSTVAPTGVVPTTAPAGTGVAPGPTSPPLATAGAGKAAALSGGALAGVLGLAAFIL
jgi:hypothetical protein